MKRQIYRQLLVALCCSLVLSMGAKQKKNVVITQYNVRPQSLNSARKVSGEVPGKKLVHLWEQDDRYGYFGATFEYDRTFRPSAIAQAFFGDCLTTATSGNSCNNDCQDTTLLIQGTGVASRDPRALRAEDLYLAADYSGTLSFKPEISNFLIDFQFYLGFDRHCKGAYLRVYAPFVHTQWQLNMSENIVAAGTNVNYGSFSPNTLLTSSDQLLPSASSYFAGNQPANVTQNLTPSGGLVGLNPVTIVRNPLCISRMVNTDCTSTDTCKKRHNSRDTKNGFGDIRAELGWNFWQDEDRHVGINLQAAAPTGNRPNGTYLFSPVVGNGKHWEFGGGLTGHYLFCRSEDESRQFGIFVDATVTHLFKNTQTRSFDLKNNGPLSRYMVAVKNQFIQPNQNNLTSWSGINPDASTDIAGSLVSIAQYSFANEFTPVANLTKQKINVSVGAQADISIWFNYTGCALSWDLGYNFYGQTAEHITKANGCTSLLALQPNTWTLKGDAYVYGYFPTNGSFTGAPAAGGAVPLPVSESTATITSPAVPFATATNQNVDNITGFAAADPEQQYGTAFGPSTMQTLQLFSGVYTTADAIRMSTQPIFLGDNDINYKQRSRIITNKIFTHVQYKHDRDCWSPFIGLGGEVEFGNSAKDRCNTQCDNGTVQTASTCTSTACTTPCTSALRIGATQWGIWLKTGVAFN